MTLSDEEFSIRQSNDEAHITRSHQSILVAHSADTNSIQSGFFIERPPRFLKADIPIPPAARRSMSTRLWKLIHHALIVTDADRFAWAVIVEGGRYEQSQAFFGSLNMHILPKWKLYKALEQICFTLIEKLTPLASQTLAKFSLILLFVLMAVGRKGDR